MPHDDQRPGLELRLQQEDREHKPDRSPDPQSLGNAAEAQREESEGRSGSAGWRQLPTSSAAPLRFRVVHSLPGRVRLRVAPESADRGEELARRLAGHPDVRSTRWTPAARSLTVEFDPGVSFTDVVSLIPSEGRVPADEIEVRRQPLWRQFLLPVVSLAVAFTGPGLVTRVAIAVCATPIVRRAVRSLVGRRLTIDVLDTVAVSLLLLVGDSLAAGVSVALIETGERGDGLVGSRRPPRGRQVREAAAVLSLSLGLRSVRRHGRLSTAGRLCAGAGAQPHAGPRRHPGR
jgi:hypothetical protein